LNQENIMSVEVQAINRVREQARKQLEHMHGFDYNAPAELFPSRSRKGRSVTYRRFETAAEALRFSLEQVPEAALLGAYLEVNEARFGLPEMRHLYESPAYPLPRAVNAD
jgi:hypothetical protein